MVETRFPLRALKLYVLTRMLNDPGRTPQIACVGEQLFGVRLPIFNFKFKFSLATPVLRDTIQCLNCAAKLITPEPNGPKIGHYDVLNISA